MSSHQGSCLCKKVKVDFNLDKKNLAPAIVIPAEDGD